MAGLEGLIIGVRNVGGCLMNPELLSNSCLVERVSGFEVIPVCQKNGVNVTSDIVPTMPTNGSAGQRSGINVILVL